MRDSRARLLLLNGVAVTALAWLFMYIQTPDEQLAEWTLREHCAVWGTLVGGHLIGLGLILAARAGGKPTRSAPTSE
jgi:hypothetical protein